MSINTFLLITFSAMTHDNHVQSNGHEINHFCITILLTYIVISFLVNFRCQQSQWSTINTGFSTLESFQCFVCFTAVCRTSMKDKFSFHCTSFRISKQSYNLLSILFHVVYYLTCTVLYCILHVNLQIWWSSKVTNFFQIFKTI